MADQSIGTREIRGRNAFLLHVAMLASSIFFKRLYVLFHVHMSTRRILAAACAAEANEAWVTQQARQLTWTLADEGIKLGYVIHDRDKKFSPKADAVFKSEGARILLTPLMAPLANSVAERWVGSCRRQVLDRMLILSQRHLEAVLHEYLPGLQRRVPTSEPESMPAFLPR